MFSIGEFARHGRVSVRMLRHYDAIGLLRPASVDPASDYRFYQASQLAELNRVIALKDLGFSLQQVQAILTEQVSAAELRGMLKLRRAEIHAQIEAETARVARVEARLLTIEEEGRIPADGVVIKRVAPVRVAELTGEATSFEPEAITPVIQPLYSDLWCGWPALALPRRARQSPTTRTHLAATAPSSFTPPYPSLPKRPVLRTSASWTWRRLTARRSSFITAQWMTCCPPGRPWRCGSTPMGTSRSATPARSPSSGPPILISG
jgi:DNA-binding transcriptional MerR regulator